MSVIATFETAVRSWCKLTSGMLFWSYIHRFRKGMSKIDTAVGASCSAFCSKLGEFGTTMVCVVRLSPLEAVLWRTRVMLPPPLSSWRLGPYRLHCLHGWWSFKVQELAHWSHLVPSMSTDIRDMKQHNSSRVVIAPCLTMKSHRDRDV